MDEMLKGKTFRKPKTIMFFQYKLRKYKRQDIENKNQY
jgi:hypothetical protein